MPNRMVVPWPTRCASPLPTAASEMIQIKCRRVLDMSRVPPGTPVASIRTHKITLSSAASTISPTLVPPARHPPNVDRYARSPRFSLAPSQRPRWPRQRLLWSKGKNGRERLELADSADTAFCGAAGGGSSMPPYSSVKLPADLSRAILQTLHKKTSQGSCHALSMHLSIGDGVCSPLSVVGR